MRLVERESQLTRLDKLFADSVAGRGRVALVSGAIGQGKTALLHAFAERTAATFLSATGTWAERGLRFGVLSQLLHDPAISARVRRAVRPQQTPAVHLALLEHAERAPLVIGVDDVDLADAASLDSLLTLVRRLKSARVLFVFTESARATRNSFLAEITRLPHCTRIPLGPLTRQGVAELDGDARIARLSRGNPLLVKAFLEDDLPHAVLRCLLHGGPSVVRAAQAMAVLGDDATTGVIARLIGVAPETVGHAVKLLTDTGLLDEGRFRHDTTKEVALQSTTPRQRAALHARAALLLHNQGEPAHVVARHLLAAPERCGPWAVPVLRQAADHGDAVRCLDLAYRSSVDRHERLSIRTELAKAEWRVSPQNAVRHLPALCEAARSGQLDRDTARTLAGQLLWHGRFDDAAEVLGRFRDDDIEHWLTCVHPALARWRHLPDTATPESALAAVLTRNETATSRAEQFLQGAPLTGDMPWGAVFALLALTYTDQLVGAATWCDRLLAHTEPVSWRAMFDAVRAEIALRQGDLSEARTRATSALTLLPSGSWGTAVVFPLSCVITACTRAGRYAEAGEHLAQPLPDGALQTRFGLHYLHARGEYQFTTGRYDAALVDFLHCGELMRQWGQDNADVVPWRASAAQVLLERGETDRARRLLREQLTRPSRGRAKGFSLRLLAAASEPAEKAQLLTEAVEVLEDCGDRYGLAYALSRLSTAHQALGQHRRARMTVRRAWHVAAECGIAPLSAELLPGRTADDQVSERAASLTDAERRVAALAAAGHTNREIARKLYVTASTVEQHLTRVYRKLDIKYRRELPASLHADMAHTA